MGNSERENLKLRIKQELRICEAHFDNVFDLINQYEPKVSQKDLLDTIRRSLQILRTRCASVVKAHMLGEDIL